MEIEKQPETLESWVKWATNNGIRGGTCISPHIRCHDDGFCNKCEYYEFCTVTSKKLRKK